MKIAVIIPSFNEAENIADMLRKVDTGICDLNMGNEHVIVSVDNGSTDGTQSVIANTSTKTHKVFIDNSAITVHGKGANIAKGLEYAKDFDAVLMFDADLKTFEPSWVALFVYEIVTNKKDLVAPIYTRNRYEGNTTNHFSCPLLSVAFDYLFLQPISGDFGFSKRLVNLLQGAFTWESDFKYGVDTVITWTALGNGLEVSQIQLGKKIHNPSFGKIVPMFQQVSISTIKQLSLNRERVLSNLKNGINILNTNIQLINIDEEFVSKPSQESIQKTAQLVKERLTSTTFIEISKELGVVGIEYQPWVNGLATIATKALLTPNMSYEYASKLETILSPLYLLRVLQYFDEIENLGVSDINILLSNQLKQIGDALTERIKL
jgi:glycosyltransferase involved in cell wall biosynthesis